MDRRPVIYGAGRQTYRVGKSREGKAYAQCLIRTLPQSKEFQPVSVSYGVSSVCVLSRISQRRVRESVFSSVSVRVCVRLRACVRRPKKNAAVITLTAAQ